MMKTRSCFYQSIKILGIPLINFYITEAQICVKNVQIQSFFGPNTGKHGAEKTPNLDSFHAVQITIPVLYWGCLTSKSHLIKEYQKLIIIIPILLSFHRKSL